MDFNSMVDNMNNQAQDVSTYNTKQGYQVDERLYKISKDQKGNGSVIVRFLPSLNTNQDNLNMFKVMKTHAVENEKMVPGKDRPEIRKWFGDEAICPRNFDAKADCPICNYGWDMHKETTANEGKEKAKKWLSFVNNDTFITNIMVIKDEINPANNGKIFLFKPSKTVVDIIQRDTQPDADEIENKGAKAFNAYDLTNSKNMMLKFTNKKDPKWKVPGDYWGHSYFVNDFSAIVDNGDDFKKLVTDDGTNETAYNLDEFFDADKVCPTEEFLEEKLKFLSFEDNKAPAKEQKTVQDTPEEKTVQEEPAEQKTEVVETPTQKVVKEEPKVESKPAQNQDDFFADILGN